MSERYQCEVCNRWFIRHNCMGKYCSAKCRQMAYLNRKRVLNRMAAYTLDARQLEDVKTIQSVSAEAAAAILKVCSVCGQTMAAEVLDGMWALLVGVGFMDREV